MKFKNLNTLKLFVEGNKLSDDNSTIYFKANVSIITITSTIQNCKMRVSITFDGFDNYGTVMLIENQLDPFSFPTLFKAQWQNFEILNGNVLHISGSYKQNIKIGKYEVKITPL